MKAKIKIVKNVGIDVFVQVAEDNSNDYHYIDTITGKAILGLNPESELSGLTFLQDTASVVLCRQDKSTRIDFPKIDIASKTVEEISNIICTRLNTIVNWIKEIPAEEYTQEVTIS